MTYRKKHCRTGTKGASRLQRMVIGGVVATLTIVGPTVAAAATSMVSSSGFSASPSLGASSGVGSTKDEVAALRAEISRQAGRIHDYTSAYTKAALQASVLSQELRAQRGSLGGLRRRLDGAQHALRQAAIQSYTSDGLTDGATAMSGSVDPAVSSEYLTVATGDVSDLEDGYQLDQRQVTTAITTLTSEQKANATALAEATTARSGALRTAEADQGELSSLEARLASLQAGAAQGGPANNGLIKSTQHQTGSTGSPPGTTPPTTSPPTTGPPTTGPPTTRPPSSGSPGTTAPPTTPPSTAPPSTTPPTTTPPTTAPPTTGGGAGGVWLELRECESGDNYQENTGNGFFGAYQFSQTTWTGLGYPGRPDLEAPSMQDAAAMKLQAEAGWGQWPACSAALGL